MPIHTKRVSLTWIFAALPLLTSCSSTNINLWPFGSSTPTEVSRVPPDATDYRCDRGRSFYLRRIDGADAVWIILPDRQVRLDRDKSSSPERYVQGALALALADGKANVTDGGNPSYSNCAPAMAQESTK